MGTIADLIPFISVRYNNQNLVNNQVVQLHSADLSGFGFLLTLGVVNTSDTETTFFWGGQLRRNNEELLLHVLTVKEVKLDPYEKGVIPVFPSNYSITEPFHYSENLLRMGYGTLKFEATSNIVPSPLSPAGGKHPTLSFSFQYQNPT